MEFSVSAGGGTSTEAPFSVSARSVSGYEMTGKFLPIYANATITPHGIRDVLVVLKTISLRHGLRWLVCRGKTSMSLVCRRT